MQLGVLVACGVVLGVLARWLVRWLESRLRESVGGIGHAHVFVTILLWDSCIQGGRKTTRIVFREISRLHND